LKGLYLATDSMVLAGSVVMSTVIRS
jgi:hypothetical protein